MHVWARFLAGLLTLLAAARPGFLLGEAGGIKNPNVLLITIDTLRPDRLGCYESPYLKTPAIDALAGRGVVFTRAFAHNPETLPSHANIMLGVTAAVHGVHDNTNFVVRPEFPTLASWLKGRGYATAAIIGAFPLDSRFGLTRGFDFYDDDYGTQSPDRDNFVERPAEVVASRAAAWIAGKKGPWFLWVHFFDPHQPYKAPQPFADRFRNDPYSGEVAYTDNALGGLLDFLKKHDLEGKTLVVLTADHGESLGEHGEATHGYFAYDSTIGIPLIIAGPGFKPGRAQGTASHIDIFPTICDLCGGAKPASLQGISLVPAIRGGDVSSRLVYFESLMANCTRGWAPIRGFVDGRMKYIDSPIPELYDLDKDPGETVNLAPRTDLGVFKSRLRAYLAGAPTGGESGAKRAADRETREKLGALGYVASPRLADQKQFTEKDDLKTLLPFHNRCQQADLLISRGRSSEAITALESIIAERGDFEDAYTNLAKLFNSLGRALDAAETLKRGNRMNPRSYQIAVLYANALSEMGRNDEAVEILKKQLALIDYDPEGWNYLGGAYLNQKNFREAEKAFERALQIDRNYAVVVNNLGTLYLTASLDSKDRELLAKAIARFQRAIQIDPAYVSPYNGLGAALKISGDLDGAIRNWEKAVALKPDFRFALFNLGLAYLAKGEKPKALEHLTHYRDRFSAALSTQERTQLEALIQKCIE
jgi:arylsulfatase A-like enzyme/tetratricopeptide (TPR) repeat protein